jgi:hypothetical protein
MKFPDSLIGCFTYGLKIANICLVDKGPEETNGRFRRYREEKKIVLYRE